MTGKEYRDGAQNPVLAKYYSGIKPKPSEVHIILQNDSIEIRGLDGTRVSFWDFYLLQRHSYDGRQLIIKWGKKDPFEYLEVSDADFIDILGKLLKDKSLLDGKGISLEWFTFGRITLWIAGLLFVLGLLYYFAVPALFGFVSDRIPVEWEKKWAKQSMSIMIDSNSVDHTKTELVNSFYQQLGHLSPYEIRIFVIRDSVVNAFAMPGGILVLHTAILNRMTSYPQLVGLLGHEIAHVEKRHSLKAIVKSMGGLVMIQLLFGGFDIFSGFILDQLRSFESLAYSRSLEKEADQEAVEFCIKSRVSPQGILGLFEILQKVESDQALSVPGFMRTHPLTKDRIAHASQLIEIKSDAIVLGYQPVLDSLFCELKEIH